MVKSYHTMKDAGVYTWFDTEPREECIHMGFELEVDRRSYSENISNHAVTNEVDKICEAFDKSGFLQYEDDGSLSYGFETISQPASLKFHLDNMEMYKQIFTHYIRNGFISHDNARCGLHIHLDKKYFGNQVDTASAKMIYLFEKHWNNMVKFSRRTEDQIEDWAGRYHFDGRHSTLTKCVKEKNYGRYFAVNLENDDTIEIRLWRGTLNHTTFKATLKFTARLAELCKTKSAIELHKMSWEEILGDDEDILTYWDFAKRR